MNDKPNAYLHNHLGQKPGNDYVPPEKVRIRQFEISKNRINNPVRYPKRHNRTEKPHGHARTE